MNGKPLREKKKKKTVKGKIKPGKLVKCKTGKEPNKGEGKSVKRKTIKLVN